MLINSIGAADFFRKAIISLRYRLIFKPYSFIVRNYILAADKNFEPKVVVLIDGGLGSQMWQYSLGRLVAMKSGLPVLYDLSWFGRDGLDINKKCRRAYRLEAVFPNVRVRKTDVGTARIYRTYFSLYPGTRMEYDEDIVTSAGARYLGGYYVNAEYIDQQGDALRDELKFSVQLYGENEKIMSEIMSTHNSVALHIRRGDYVGSLHDVTTPKYFIDAVRFVSEKLSPEKAVFFVFSNGMDWSREILRDLDEKFIFVENNDNDNGEADMFLMSRCAHFIISNSSFSWWAAWLSRRPTKKIVIFPEIWFSGRDPEYRGAMGAAGWIPMSVD